MNFQAQLEQLRRMWTSLAMWQRVSIVVAAVAVVGGVAGLSQWRREGDFKPLFTRMNPEDAGAIVEKLKESGTEYRVADNGASVLVRSERVAEARLQIAAAGLPRMGRIGFELFDKTNLGTTDFGEQINYRRALEGELERSIRSVAEVEQARVHLTFAKDSVFLDSRTPAKASVLLKVRAGVPLAPANVTAITHLVSSAVDGLTPDAVSIMDNEGNLLTRPKKNGDPDSASDESIEYRKKLERDLLEKANGTLEPLLGKGRYRIGLSVDCDFASGEQSEETYDPEKSVMLTSQRTEETNAALSIGGVPGTASNLPRPPARSASGGGAVSRKAENISYQSSRTVRRVKLPQGSIRRISASLLLDHTIRWESTNGQMQRTLVPPSAENLRAIRELVSAAIGVVPSRGDQLVIESLPFEDTLQAPSVRKVDSPGPVKSPQAAPQDQRWPGLVTDWRIAAAAGGVMLLLAAALFLWRRKARNKRMQVVSSSAPAIEAGEGAMALTSGDLPALAAASGKQPSETSQADAIKVDTLLETLRASIAADPTLAAGVLRVWLEEAQA